MAFNYYKSKNAAVHCSIISIEYKSCFYATEEAIVRSKGYAVNDIAQSGSNVEIQIDNNANSTQFNADWFPPEDRYIKINEEIMSFSIYISIGGAWVMRVNDSDRGLFGTTPAAHSAGDLVRIVHSGEIDGSCYGYRYGCTSAFTGEADTSQYLTFTSMRIKSGYKYFTGFERGKVSHTPTKVDPGGSIGTRAKISFSIKDSRDADVYTVPWPGMRTTKGTLFTKLFARNPHLENRKVIWQEGFLDDDGNYDESNFIKREYIIDSAQLNDGTLSVTALDTLILAEDKKAKAPVESSGRLDVELLDEATEIKLRNSISGEYGVGSVLVRIDSEVISCTVVDDLTLSIVARAQGGTDLKKHSVNATVQYCLDYTSENVVDIIEDIVDNYTTIPSLAKGNWSNARAATQGVNLSAIISKPTSVTTLLNELIVNGDLAMWTEEEVGKIRLEATNELEIEPINLSERDHIIKDSLTIKRDTSKQWTSFKTGFAPNDVTKTTGDENFSVLFKSINVDQVSDVGLGENNEKKTFYNRWLTDSDLDIVLGASIVDRALSRTEQVPLEISFDLDVENVFDYQNGNLYPSSIVNVQTSRWVNSDGSDFTSNFQVLQMKDKGNMKYSILAKLYQLAVDPGEVDFIIDSDKENYDLSDDFAPTEAGIYTVYISQGVTIGSTSVDNPAFTTGNQIGGVELHFIVRGSVLGAGGKGGVAGIASSDNPLVVGAGGAGKYGGDAFECTVPCTFEVGSGAIYSGGGGAAGRWSAIANPRSGIVNPGNGGSGGQGYYGGTGAGGGLVRWVGSPSFSRFGGSGEDGSRGSEGIVGGIAGGSWGEKGDDQPDDPYLSEDNSSDGGLAGYAIKSNGFAVTISSGNNTFNIRGRRDF